MRRLLVTIAALMVAGVTGCRDKSADLVPLAYPETFDRVLEQFRGQVVYVDIFASWCQPCIREFAHAPQSDDFFAQNNIAKLYISADYDTPGIHKAFRLLQRHGMKGYFLSECNPANMQDKSNDFYRRMQEFSDMGGRMIPQFMIIDKNGNVVEYTAERPSNPDALKEQLSKYL